MQLTPSIFVVLIILVASGCAAVAPAPPVSSDPNQKPGNETLLAQINALQAPASGRPKAAHPLARDFWQQVRRDFRPSATQHEAVSKQLAEYAKKPRLIERTLERGKPYLAYIRHEVEKRGLPAEVIFVPFVESGYDPFAYSYGRAAGLWQFIPSTGKYFGLEQDWWYDERRDIIASTDAALDYLEKLQNQFDGDWLLAFAAYNAGGGTVRNAIKRNRKAGKPTDFWNLELPGETSAYIPKLLAISRIVNDPQRYGVTLPAIESAPAFAIIETGGQLDIVVAAGLAEMETDAFYQINPGFNRWATHPEGPHQLAIPTDKAYTFAHNLAKLPAAERVKWLRHKTVEGETLSHIAKRYQTTVNVLQQSNDLKTTRIRAGRYLMIPVAAKDVAGYAVLNKRLRKAKTPTNRKTHRVRTGDSLWSIAHKHQVRVTQLKKWNHLNTGSVIKPGQELVLWKNSKGTSAGKHVRTIYYAVRSGDTLSGISKKYSVGIDDLRRWNKLDKGSYLQPGQNLKIHVDVTRLTMK